MEKYSYEVLPLMAPFNNYFYIKTDNPDSDSFRFVDEENKYAKIYPVYTSDGKTGIAPADDVFSDVKYENEETRRVKGGYIAKSFGAGIDGGELHLQERKVIGTSKVNNLSTGEISYEKKI